MNGETGYPRCPPTDDIRRAPTLQACMDGCGALCLTWERWRRDYAGRDVIDLMQRRAGVEFTMFPRRRDVRMRRTPGMDGGLTGC